MFLQGFLLIVQQTLSLKVELLLKYELLCGLTKQNERFYWCFLNMI